MPEKKRVFDPVRATFVLERFAGSPGPSESVWQFAWSRNEWVAVQAIRPKLRRMRERADIIKREDTKNQQGAASPRTMKSPYGFRRSKPAVLPAELSAITFPLLSATGL